MDTGEWRLDTDPAIRWQVMRDLTDSHDDVVAAERDRAPPKAGAPGCSPSSGPDGQWGGGTYFPAWTATAWTLMLLRDLGLAPRRACAQVVPPCSEIGCVQIQFGRRGVIVG